MSPVDGRHGAGGPDYYGRFQNGSTPYTSKPPPEHTHHSSQSQIQGGGGGSRHHQSNQHYSSSYSHHRGGGGRTYSLGPTGPGPEQVYGIPRIGQPYTNGAYSGSKSNLEVSQHRSPGKKPVDISPRSGGPGLGPPDYRGAGTLPAKLPPGELIVSDDRPDGVNVYPVYKTERAWNVGYTRNTTTKNKWDPLKAATDKIVRWKWIEWVSFAQIALGLCLIALGILRLALRTVVGNGIELAFGIFVVAIGIVGLIAAKRGNFCLLVAFFTMSALAIILAIAPLIAGLLVALPSSLLPSTRDGEPLGIDFVVVAVCILEMIVAIFSCVIGCMMYGRMMKNWSARRAKDFGGANPPPGANQLQLPAGSVMNATNGGDNLPPPVNGGGKRF